MDVKRTATVLLVALLVTILTEGTENLALAAPASDDPSPVMVTVSEMHICCGACVKAIEKAARVDGVQAEVDEDEKTVVLTAATYADVQRSLDEIAKAGFSGKIEDDTQAGKVSFPEIKTSDENVKKLTVSNIHNCCHGCSDAIIDAIESVDGVTSNTVKPKEKSFVVEGNFDAGEVVTALLDEGFYPTIQ